MSRWLIVLLIFIAILIPAIDSDAVVPRSNPNLSGSWETPQGLDVKLTHSPTTKETSVRWVYASKATGIVYLHGAGLTTFDRSGNFKIETSIEDFYLFMGGWLCRTSGNTFNAQGKVSKRFLQMKKCMLSFKYKCGSSWVENTVPIDCTGQWE